MQFSNRTLLIFISLTNGIVKSYTSLLRKKLACGLVSMFLVLMWTLKCQSP